jgi:hypothetical protein
VATVLEVCNTEEQRSGCVFCGQNDPMQRIFIMQCFPVYGGKCLSRKAAHNWVEKFSQGRSKVVVLPDQVQK